MNLSYCGKRQVHNVNEVVCLGQSGGHRLASELSLDVRKFRAERTCQIHDESLGYALAIPRYDWSKPKLWHSAKSSTRVETDNQSYLRKPVKTE